MKGIKKKAIVETIEKALDLNYVIEDIVFDKV